MVLTIQWRKQTLSKWSCKCQMSFSNCVQKRETDFFGNINIFFNGLHEFKKKMKNWASLAAQW